MERREGLRAILLSPRPSHVLRTHPPLVSLHLQNLLNRLGFLGFQDLINFGTILKQILVVSRLHIAAGGGIADRRDKAGDHEGLSKDSENAHCARLALVGIRDDLVFVPFLDFINVGMNRHGGNGGVDQ